MAYTVNPIDIQEGPDYHVAINASSAGSNTVVAAVTGKRICVVKYKAIGSGTVDGTWQSSGGTVLDGPCPYALTTGAAEARAVKGCHFATLAGEGLVLYLSGAVRVSGNLVYKLTL